MTLPPHCNKYVANSSRSSVLAAALAAFLWANPAPVSATTLHFSLDTTSLSGTAASLAFDFIAGDSISGNNTVVVSDFYTTGTPGNSSSIGGVTVTHPGPFPVTLTDIGLSLMPDDRLELEVGITHCANSDPIVCVSLYRALFPIF
jgi:hypothetical protein